MTVGMGLELKLSEIQEIARDRQLLVKALIANFVLQPAAAVALLSGKAVLDLGRGVTADANVAL
jgi:predicted Na+-dependent transporter